MILSYDAITLQYGLPRKKKSRKEGERKGGGDRGGGGEGRRREGREEMEWGGRIY